MNTNPKNFCRDLTADERKQIKANGELAGIDYSAPLLAWKNKAGNEIRFFEVWSKCLFESPFSHYVAIKDGIVIVVETASGLGRLFFSRRANMPPPSTFTTSCRWLSKKATICR